MPHSLPRSTAIAVVSMSMSIPLMPATAFGQGPAALEEVVVSARKREETLQEVPLSVSVLSGIDIENKGLSSVDDLYGRVPGLYFSYGGGAAPTSDFSYITMRGVGFNGGLEPAAGVFIDGMYQPQVGYDMAFLDLERVEVLRGPQGTLFGRNTQAGAINMVTRKPGEEMRGSVGLEVAEFGTLRARGSISGQVADSLYAGVSVEHAESDGFIDNITLNTDEDYFDQMTSRGTLRWAPNDRLEVMLVGDFSSKDFNDQAVGVPLAPRRYESLGDELVEDRKRNKGVQLNVDYELTESVTLTSISGYRQAESDITLDYDALPTEQSVYVFPSHPGSPLSASPVTAQGLSHQVVLDQEFLSQELRLSGTVERLEWLLGAYYFEQDMDQDRDFTFGPGARFLPLYIRERFFEERDGYAIFGQGSFNLTEQLEITAGARYSKENVAVGGPRVLALNVGVDVFNPLLKEGDADFDNVSGMVSAGYNFSDDVNVYATFAQGWKAGGLNRFPSRADAVLPYDDEESENWELGVKSSLFDNRLVANLAAFWIDIEGQQLLNVVPDPAGLTPITVIDNAADSRSRGIELEVQAYPVERLQLGAAISIADTEFRDFLKADASGNSVDFSGKSFESVPETTATGSLTYTHPVTSRSNIEFYTEYRYVGGYDVPDGTLVASLGAQERVPSHDRLDLRLSYVTDGGFRATAYVRNALDSFDYVAYSGELIAGGEPFFVKPLPPRQFGIMLRQDF